VCDRQQQLPRRNCVFSVVGSRHYAIGWCMARRRAASEGAATSLCTSRIDSSAQAVVADPPTVHSAPSAEASASARAACTLAVLHPLASVDAIHWQPMASLARGRQARQEASDASDVPSREQGIRRKRWWLCPFPSPWPSRPFLLCRWLWRWQSRGFLAAGGHKLGCGPLLHVPLEQPCGCA
jgi:hypothetical protein